MYEKTYGAKYEQTKGLRRVEIAKLIRADIKAAVAAGELPKVSYSVRASGGGNSIHVRIAWKARPVGDRPAIERYTAETRALRSAVEQIVEAYNYDCSDLQSDYFDVRFYGSVDIEEDGDAMVTELRSAAAAALIDPEVLAVARASNCNDYRPVGLVAAVGWED